MLSSKVRFQSLLRELFRLNWGDFDFGMYCFFNAWRVDLEEFIGEELEHIVAEGLAWNEGETNAVNDIFNHLITFFEHCICLERTLKSRKANSRNSHYLGNRIPTWDDRNQYFVSRPLTKEGIRAKLGEWLISIRAGRINIVKGNVDKNTYYWVPTESFATLDDGQKLLTLMLEHRPLTQSN